jgi:hypothetical protein
MKVLDELNYRQWQKRNTESFGKLSANQKYDARQKGYLNTGWKKVENSWRILKSFGEVITIFDAKLKKGNVSGAIDQCIFEAEQAQEIAQRAIRDLNDNQDILTKVAKATLNKYQLL